MSCHVSGGFRLCALATVLAGTGCYVWGRRQFNRRVDRALARLDRPGESQPLQPSPLPPEVKALAARARPGDRPSAGRVRLRQRGVMWSAPKAPPIAFTATQHIAVRHSAFVWLADVRLPLGPSIRVLDCYVEGAGDLEARLLGSLPIARAQGPEISRGELIRYLAELPWCPDAMIDNAALAWRALDNQTLQVSTGLGPEQVMVRLTLDEEGDVVRVDANRPRRVGNQDVSTPWTGLFSAYREIDGYRIPTHGEVRWQLASGPFTYWRGEITDFNVAHDADLPQGVGVSHLERGTRPVRTPRHSKRGDGGRQSVHGL